MYWVIFGVGAGFILISLILGELVEVELETSAFAFMRPMVIAVFLVVMGGLGLIMTRNADFIGGGGIVLFIATVSGLLVAGLFNRFVLIPLHNAQNTSAFHKQSTIGMEARVISKIPQGGYGKIRFSVSGSTVTSPAKCEKGNEIPQGETVEIIYIEKGAYFVRYKPDNAN